MKIYYIYYDLKDPTHRIFEGTSEQFTEQFSGGSNNEESILEFVAKEGWFLKVFNDVPDDYYTNEVYYNRKGICIGYTLYNSFKIGY